MGKLTFDETFERLIGHEGGYVNNPKDPGGETNWGISKRSYPSVNIKGLTRDDAKEIYKKDFWDRVGGDRLPSSVVYQLFDFAVNSGAETAVRYLQRAVGVADDGNWGAASQAASVVIGEQNMLFLLNAERLEYMTKLKGWDAFSKGWARRIAGNLRYAAKDS